MNFTQKFSIGLLTAFAAIALITLTSMTMDRKETRAYLEITLTVAPEKRGSAAGVYLKYKEPFLAQIDGATSKELLIRTEDVQVLHGFESEEEAKAYLGTELFENDVVRELMPFFDGNPEIRIYSVFKDE